MINMMTSMASTIIWHHQVQLPFFPMTMLMILIFSDDNVDEHEDYNDTHHQVTHVRGVSNSRSDCVWKCRELAGEGLALTKWDLDDHLYRDHDHNKKPCGDCRQSAQIVFENVENLPGASGDDDEFIMIFCFWVHTPHHSYLICWIISLDWQGEWGEGDVLLCSSCCCSTSPDD